ncbi:MAG: ABC transporter ATP-binding protein [Anaerolineae bacterium]|nr:ABC transporter ATP-binding protein [Anaerolineae bacterium]
MSIIIEINDLYKRYGRRTAVDGISLKVEEGDIYGFVGPNGAGKTSTMRIMATLLAQSEGDILVGGHSVKDAPRQVREKIGFMPDFFGVYNDMVVWEYLDFFSACYEIPREQRSKLVEDLLELVDLSHRRNDPVEKLSRGMKQRLNLARTLVHDPQVLILDEPASGLDPRARAEIRELLQELAKMGKTIFFSTHILADVAEICTRVGIIEAGKIVAAGTLDEIQQALTPFRAVQLSILDKQSETMTLLEKTKWVSNLTVAENNHSKSHIRLKFDFSGDDRALSELLAIMVKAGIPVVHLSEDSRNMESVFLRATRGLVT